jgi:hypothetical protein
MESKLIRLIYDCNSIPGGIDLDRLYNIICNSGIVVYDSTRGTKPEVIDKDLTTKDVSLLSLEEFLDKYEPLMEEKKKWVFTKDGWREQ